MWVDRGGCRETLWDTMSLGAQNSRDDRITDNINALGYKNNPLCSGRQTKSQTPGCVYQAPKMEHHLRQDWADYWRFTINLSLKWLWQWRLKSGVRTLVGGHLSMEDDVYVWIHEISLQMQMGCYIQEPSVWQKLGGSDQPGELSIGKQLPPLQGYWGETEDADRRPWDPTTPSANLCETPQNRGKGLQQACGTLKQEKTCWVTETENMRMDRTCQCSCWQGNSGPR